MDHVSSLQFDLTSEQLVEELTKAAQAKQIEIQVQADRMRKMADLKDPRYCEDSNIITRLQNDKAKIEKMRQYVIKDTTYRLPLGQLMMFLTGDVAGGDDYASDAVNSKGPFG